jgi:tRNA(Ile)-lysidine synthase
MVGGESVKFARSKRMPLIIKNVLGTIEKYSMLRKGDRVLIGVSGGPDSIALLHILLRLKDEYELKLKVGHLNHGLRGEESDRDERFVKNLCKQLKIKCYTKRLKKGELESAKGVSPEESARRARYKYFEWLSKKLKCNRIALGHTADDQAETVLMRFVRGSGLRGLGGIPPVRKNGLIIRPLINLWRKEIEEFLEKEKILFVIDSTNESMKFLRNRLRQELIPYIEKNFNPNIKECLVRMGELFRYDEELLSEFLRTGKNFYEITGDKININLKIFKKLSEPAQLRVIRRAIEEFLGDLRHFQKVHFNDILKIAMGKKPNVKIVLPRDLIAIREYSKLSICYNKNGELMNKFKVKLKINGKTLISALKSTIESEVISRNEVKTLNVSCNMALLDFDKLKKPLVVRTYEHGDRFIPLGSSGSKKLKDFFIDLKIPLEERYRTPILVSNDRIAWVAGLRIDDRFKVTEETKRILRLKIHQNQEE